MRTIWTSINIGCYLMDGCDKLLPKDIREKLDGKIVEVRFDSYPLELKDDTMCEEMVGFVFSPKTYGDLMNPYREWFNNVVESADSEDNDKYEFCHSIYDCYLDDIVVDCKNQFAIINIGS